MAKDAAPFENRSYGSALRREKLKFGIQTLERYVYNVLGLNPPEKLKNVDKNEICKMFILAILPHPTGKDAVPCRESWLMENTIGKLEKRVMY